MYSAVRRRSRGRAAVIFRHAFTVAELAVVLVILAALLGLLVPAMQSMRELSRRRNCEQNLIQLSLAIANYSTQHEHYPIGTFNPSGPIRSEPTGYHHNWIEGLLPLLDAPDIHQAIDRSVSVYHRANQPVRMMTMPKLRCPSASGVQENTTCYAAIDASTETPIDVDNDGVFLLNRMIRPDDITDGLSYTIFIAEKVSSPAHDLGWLSGTRSSLRNAGHPIQAGDMVDLGEKTSETPLDPLYVGGIASQHAGGAFLLKGSGECEFRSPSMDVEVLQQMASRASSPTSPDRKSPELQPAEVEPDSQAEQQRERAAEPAERGKDDSTKE